MDDIADKAKEKLAPEDDKDEGVSGPTERQTTANNPDPQQGAGDADQAPNPTKAAEDVD
jgi:hypothetical protein